MELEYQNLYKESDAFEIIEELNQLKRLQEISKLDKKTVFNINLVNSLYENEMLLDNWIKTLIKRWEENYGQQFKIEDHLPAYERARVNNDQQGNGTGTPDNNDAAVEQKDSRVA